MTPHVCNQAVEMPVGIINERDDYIKTKPSQMRLYKMNQRSGFVSMTSKNPPTRCKLPVTRTFTGLI